MKQKGIWLLVVFLSSILVIPLSYSNAEMENDTNSTTSINATASEQDDIGQQVSEFVHQAIIQFKQQRNETLAAIKDCREKIKDATPDMKNQVVNECHKTRLAIKEKYKDERQQFQDLFKRFRENIITLRQETNATLDHDKDMAIKKINDNVAKNGLGGLENALKHLKGMALQHGKLGIEHAMQEVNKTRGMEVKSSSNASISGNEHVPVPPLANRGHDDNSTPGEGKGKK